MPPTPRHTQRAAWVDAARCLAMLLILWLHSSAQPMPWLSEPVGGGICLFFILAGRFMPEEPGAAARRALRLGLAWALWSMLSLGLYILAQPGVEWTWARAFGWGEPAYNTPLWFLRNLCLYQLILAALGALHLLPRYGWLLLALLLGATYAAEPAQHVGLRFDWLSAVLLGRCLRPLPLDHLRSRLVEHAPALLTAGLLLLCQRHWYPRLLTSLGVHSYASSLHIAELAWAVAYLLAGIGILRLCRPLGQLMAQTGPCMLFIYAAHSLAYAPLYRLELPSLCRLALMTLLLALLTLLYKAMAYCAARNPIASALRKRLQKNT